MPIIMGLLGGFKLPGFLKSPFFWKVATLVVAAFFIWNKATDIANARWEFKLAQETALLKAQSTKLINQQRDGDMKRIHELEDINESLKSRNIALAQSRKKNALSDNCNACRIPRGRSPGRLRGS